MQQHSDTEFRHDGSVRDRLEWRREEHGRFMQALELYGSRQTGNEWTLITDFVGSRTIEEVQLHGRQYLHRLVQQLPQSPMTALPNRYLSSAGSQNDPNRQNYQSLSALDLQKLRDDNEKRATSQLGGSTSALSAAALECALSMNVHAPIQFRSQPLQPLQQQSQTGIAAPSQGSKAWTFQEEKAFETALAGWAGSRSYPWTKIAATVPGRTVKEVRNRFDEMVGEIASIEAGEIPLPESSTSSNSVIVRQQGPSSLSRRAIAPPPIEVLPRNANKDEGVGSFPVGTSTRSTSGIAMLSPTFLDMLANEAESEEKSPLPALPLPFPGLANLPSPLFAAPAFFSPGNKKKTTYNQHATKLSRIDTSNDVKMEDVSTEPSNKARRSSTPRIMSEFLAEHFRLDDPLGTTPIHHRKKSPRVKTSTSFEQTQAGTDTQNVEMTDASAA